MALPKWVKPVSVIIGAIIAINFLEVYGVIGVILFLLILVGYRLFISRESLKIAMGNIETMIFGKPLKKELWDKGELNNTKIELSFSKGKFRITKYHFYALGMGLLLVLVITLWRIYK